MGELCAETSMLCELWVDADDVGTAEYRPGTHQCGGITRVDHSLKYSPELHGKLRHRICDKCHYHRMSQEVWTGTVGKKRSTASKPDNHLVLPFGDD